MKIIKNFFKLTFGVIIIAWFATLFLSMGIFAVRSIVMLIIGTGVFWNNIIELIAALTIAASIYFNVADNHLLICRRKLSKWLDINLFNI